MSKVSNVSKVRKKKRKVTCDAFYIVYWPLGPQVIYTINPKHKGTEHAL